MILVFKDVIINMDNVALIEVTGLSNDSVTIAIATTAIRHYGGGGYSSAFAKEFAIKTSKWHELIKAIQNNERVFVLNE